MIETWRPVPSLPAWRFWGVRPDGSLTNAGRTPVEHVWSRWGNVATCPRGHSAPAERCFCGLHVLIDEDDVRKLARTARPALALGPVMLTGRMMRSEVAWDPRAPVESSASPCSVR